MSRRQQSSADYSIKKKVNIYYFICYYYFILWRAEEACKTSTNPQSEKKERNLEM